VSTASSFRRFGRRYYPIPHSIAVRNSKIPFICLSVVYLPMKLVTSARLIGLESFTDSEQASRKDVVESSSEICLTDCGKQDGQSMYNITGHDISVGIATSYGLDGSGIESLLGARFSAPVQTSSGAHPASYTMGTGSCTGLESGRGVALTTYPYLAPRLQYSSTTNMGLRGLF
jgi:hypothetical protein